LDAATGRWDKAFDSGRVVSTGEFLLLRLDALENGNSENVGIDLFVQVENVKYLLRRFGFRKEGGVALLP
jgi:hypothetical protein